MQIKGKVRFCFAYCLPKYFYDWIECPNSKSPYDYAIKIDPNILTHIIIRLP